MSSFEIEPLRPACPVIYEVRTHLKHLKIEKHPKKKKGSRIFLMMKKLRASSGNGNGAVFHSHMYEELTPEQLIYSCNERLLKQFTVGSFLIVAVRPDRALRLVLPFRSRGNRRHQTPHHGMTTPVHAHPQTWTYSASLPPAICHRRPLHGPLAASRCSSTRAPPI